MRSGGVLVEFVEDERISSLTGLDQVVYIVPIPCSNIWSFRDMSFSPLPKQLSIVYSHMNLLTLI